MGQGTLASGLKALRFDRAAAYRSGPMVPCTKDTGKIIRPTGMVD